MANYKEYKSIDPNTGLITDIDELRDAGIRMSNIIYALFDEPMFQLMFPTELAYLLAAAAVSNESRMHKMSQAQVVRKMSSLAGGPVASIMAEMQIQRYHLSETLPDTHPDAPRPEVERGDEWSSSLDQTFNRRPPRSPFAEPPNYDPFTEIGLPPTARSPLDMPAGQSDFSIITPGYEHLEPGIGGTLDLGERTELPDGIESFLRSLDKEPGESKESGNDTSNSEGDSGSTAD